LYTVVFDRLIGGVLKGFGEASADLIEDGAEKLLFDYYAHNIGIFSGAKTHKAVEEMSSLVFKPDGIKRDFSDFRRMVRGTVDQEGIFERYFDRYLRTEFDTAVAVSQMGSAWVGFEQDKDVLPYLRYEAIDDERTRRDHKQWDGITLPVDHKFWNTHTPPNGFNCRCMLIQLDEATPTPASKLKGTPPPDSELFEFNPGKSGYIFDPDKHPYTAKIAERYKVASEVNFGLPTPPKPTIPL